MSLSLKKIADNAPGMVASMHESYKEIKDLSFGLGAKFQVK